MTTVSSFPSLQNLKHFIRSNKSLLNFVRKNLFFIEGFGTSINSSLRYSVPLPSDYKHLNILMIEHGYGGKLFVRDALKVGHDVFSKYGDTIYKYTIFGLKKCYKIRKHKKDVESWQDAANKLINQPEIFRWINEKCEVDISGIILTRLQYFIHSVCPEIFENFKDYITFYNENDIDFVITSGESFPDEVAAVAAVRCSKKTKSVCFMHGNGVYALDVWDITLIDHHDISFALDEELTEYFLNRINLYDKKKNEVFPCFGLYLFSNYIKIKEKRKKALMKKNKRRPKIIYLPTLFMWDTQCIDDAWYSDTWYYKFQKALIAHFSTKKEFDFVWKGLPSSDSIYNPIPNFINDNKFENIKIATDYFVNHLISADRVIADFPSTGFYEAVIAGVPTISLYHKDLKVRKSALDFFGQLVQPFSDIPEALEKIDRFLESEPESYCTSIPLGSDAIKILEDIANRPN